MDLESNDLLGSSCYDVMGCCLITLSDPCLSIGYLSLILSIMLRFSSIIECYKGIFGSESTDSNFNVCLMLLMSEAASLLYGTF